VSLSCDFCIDRARHAESLAALNGCRVRTDIWKQMQDYLEFYSRSKDPTSCSQHRRYWLAIKKSYEPINLLARHNIPFPLLRPPTWPPIVSKSSICWCPCLPTAKHQTITDFAAQGGTAILVDLPGLIRGNPAGGVQSGDHWVASLRERSRH